MKNVIELFNGYFLREWRLLDVEEFQTGINHPDILKNLRATFPRTREQIVEFINRCLMKNEIQDFAIVNGENLVGGISFIIHEENLIELSCLWVAYPYRKNGIGKNVIKEIIVYILKEFPNYKIIGQIYEFNELEIHMVENLGFKRIGSKMESYGDGFAILLLYKYCLS